MLRINGGKPMKENLTLEEVIMSIDEYLTKREMLMQETLETNILDRKLPGSKMTLYHFSLMDLDVIKPVSINVGTKLSKVRYSSFWSKDKSYAYMWALLCFIFNEINLENLEGAVSFTLNKFFIEKYPLNDKLKKKTTEEIILQGFEKWKQKNPYFYIYTVKVPTKLVGRGMYDIPEYTIDQDIKPDKKEKIKYDEKIMDPMIYVDDYRDYFGYDELEGRRKSLLSKFIFKTPFTVSAQKIMNAHFKN